MDTPLLAPSGCMPSVKNVPAPSGCTRSVQNVPDNDNKRPWPQRDLSNGISEPQEWISEAEWTIDIQQSFDLDRLRSKSDVAIFKVPDFLKRSRKREVYVPIMVSFGPYHHTAKALEPMKSHKARAFHRMKIRFNIVRMHANMDFSFLGKQEISHLEEDIRKMDFSFLANQEISHLQEDIRKMYEENNCPTESLTLMLIFDCCFSLEILTTLGGDMFPVEEAGETSLSTDDNSGNDVTRIPRAVELKNVGIKFERCNGGIKEIDFISGTFFLPPINITDNTEVLFSNLIALEVCKASETNYVTCYVSLMDELIDAPEDVALLKKEGIVTNYLGSDAEVAQLFNGLLNGVTASRKDEFKQLKQDVDAYYRSKIKIWFAELMKEHLSSPWRSLGLAAAILLLLFTAVQTVMSVLSVYK